MLEKIAVRPVTAYPTTPVPTTSRRPDTATVLHGRGGRATKAVGELELVTEQTRASRRDASPPGRLAAALWRRSAETGAHQARIARLSQRLARELGWSDENCSAIEMAASMHDIGKLALPHRVLAKPGALGPIERKIVEAHTVLGALLLLGRAGAWVQLARSIALHHHERWDGRGYPRGLAGEAIPAAARIVAVADVYDALTHSRVYRPAFPESRAVAFMRMQRGAQFDPTVVDCFLDLLPALRGPELFVVRA
jgi:putative two-component system response regulator